MTSRLNASSSRRFIQAAGGASGLTYGLVVGLIAIGAVGSVTQIGDSVTELFIDVSSTIENDGAETGLEDRPEDTGAPVWVTDTALPAVEANEAISIQLVATDDVGIEDYIILSDPADDLTFSLSPTGLLTGSTGTTGSYLVQIAAVDAAGNQTPRLFSLTVTGNPPSFTAPTGTKLLLTESVSGDTIAEFVTDIDDGNGGSDGIASIVLANISNPGALTASSINSITGDLTYSTGNVGANTNVTADIIVTDNEGETAEASITLTVQDQLFAFTGHTFTNCGQTGHTGPSQTQCRGQYSTTSDGNWDEQNAFFTVSGGIQQWTVPKTGTYRFEVSGAQGGSASSAGGLGAVITADLSLTQGDTISLLIGQQGACDASDPNEPHCSGGGGSFVYEGSTLYVAAGAGGGGGDDGTGCNGSVTTTSNACSGNGNSTTSNGSGGASGGQWGGAGGGGWNGTGSNGFCSSNPAVNSGGPDQPGNGGLHSNCSSSDYGENIPGGFGGGGAPTWTPGGGGGYSGGPGRNSPGNGSDHGSGGGGSSFIGNGALSVGTPSATNTGHGQIVITPQF